MRRTWIQNGAPPLLPNMPALYATLRRESSSPLTFQPQIPGELVPLAQAREKEFPSFLRRLLLILPSRSGAARLKALIRSVSSLLQRRSASMCQSPGAILMRLSRKRFSGEVRKQKRFIRHSRAQYQNSMRGGASFPSRNRPHFRRYGRRSSAGNARGADWVRLPAMSGWESG